MDRSVIADVPRDKYVERCKQRAFDYLDRGDLKSAVGSFVGDTNARPDCKLPEHLAALGLLLMMANDASGGRTLIEGFSLSSRGEGHFGLSMFLGARYTVGMGPHNR